MHTIPENNYAVIKLPHNGNSKMKKINKKQFSLCKLPTKHNKYGMEALDDFTQIIHS